MANILWVCRSCESNKLISYAGPIRLYTCPKCVAQEETIRSSGGRVESK